MAKQQLFIPRGINFWHEQSKQLVQNRVLNCHRKFWYYELTIINTVKLFDCKTLDFFISIDKYWTLICI